MGTSLWTYWWTRCTRLDSGSHLWDVASAAPSRLRMPEEWLHGCRRAAGQRSFWFFFKNGVWRLSRFQAAVVTVGSSSQVNFNTMHCVAWRTASCYLWERWRKEAKRKAGASSHDPDGDGLFCLLMSSKSQRIPGNPLRTLIGPLAHAYVVVCLPSPRSRYLRESEINYAKALLCILLQRNGSSSSSSSSRVI